MALDELTPPETSRWPHRLALLVTTLWAGSLWAIGYIAVPVLFAVLRDNKMMAGMLAGQMFTITAYVGLACACYLLLHYGRVFRLAAFRQTVVRIIVILLVLNLVGQFGLQPLMADLKAQAFPADVMQSGQAARFGMLHGIAELLYAAQSLAAIALVLKTRR